MKLGIEIKSGNLELSLSGSLVTTSLERVQLTLLDNGAPLDLFLDFKNDSSNPEKFQKTAKKIEGKNAINIVFTNYNNPLGTYTAQPWQIGHAFNRELFFCFVIYGFDNSNVKKIDYSFYLGKEVKNG
ncbi:DUF6864 domain-containing function [Saccharicrinis sp. FJH2]|uniref:DUF6864 domain-containing function n=1 Tax=Saccharicrinis sp. FJH65 TaxID=3344659 RepID=UPI0035F3CBB2